MSGQAKKPIDVLIDLAHQCAVDPPPAGVERRAFPRYRLKIPVVCAELDDNLQQSSEFISSRTLNVSAGGILLVTEQELRSDKVSVTFCDLDGNPYELKAEVIHRTQNRGEFITGAVFIAAS